VRGADEHKLTVNKVEAKSERTPGDA
jgi:hypothetical protein